jgi:galactose mutarotase-like enzyme
MANEINLTTIKSSCKILPERGGLVSSLAIDGRDVLWMPEDFSQDDSSWPGGGVPLCFPFAGRVWHKGQLYQYGLDGTTYPMPIHGFAYGEPWKKISATRTQAVIELQDSERSRSIFPFAFQVQLSFNLTEQHLRIEFHVKHIKPVSDAPKMPLALGFHPYLKLTAGQDVALDVDAKKYYPVTPTGTAGKVALTTDLGPRPWASKAPLLNSLILSDLKKSRATLKTNGNDDYVKINFGPETMFHHIVVWTNRPEEFYCVEPWMSLPDAVAIPSGTKWLASGEEASGYLEISL